MRLDLSKRAKSQVFFLTLIKPKNQSEEKLQDRGVKLDEINESIFTSIDACVMCVVL